MRFFSALCLVIISCTLVKASPVTHYHTNAESAPDSDSVFLGHTQEFTPGQVETLTGAVKEGLRKVKIAYGKLENPDSQTTAPLEKFFGKHNHDVVARRLDDFCRLPESVDIAPVPNADHNEAGTNLITFTTLIPGLTSDTLAKPLFGKIQVDASHLEEFKKSKGKPPVVPRLGLDLIIMREILVIGKIRYVSLPPLPVTPFGSGKATCIKLEDKKKILNPENYVWLIDELVQSEKGSPSPPSRCRSRSASPVPQKKHLYSMRPPVSVPSS